MIRRLLLLDWPGDGFDTLAESFRRVMGPESVVHHVTRLDELLASLRADFGYDLVVVDFDQGDGELAGEALVGKIHDLTSEVPIIAAAAAGDGSLEGANRAIGAGAAEYLVRGERIDQRVETLLTKLNGLVEAIAERRSLQEESRRLRSAERERNRILGDSPEIEGLRQRIQRVASIPRPVLITGERGCGKELVARAIHDAAGPASRPANRPIVAVNCAAFPDALLESELFGHEKGAFTGADQIKRGKFELADGGTLFLDEIGNMSLPFQKKVLRTVEYGVFVRVGGSTELHTTARVIAATNVDLAEKMREGEFLRDLYDRLAFEVIRVPALREREGDIEILADEFLHRFMQEIPALQGKRLSRTALEALRRYDFPGNVRELKNIIERAAYRDTTNEITPGDIGLLDPRLAGSRPGARPGGFAEQVESLKKDLVEGALSDASGNQAAAARRLGLSYDQFRHYYRKYGDV